MTAKELARLPAAIWDHVTEKIRVSLEGLTRKQRIAVIVCMLLLFLALDAWVVARTFKEDRTPPAVEHLKR